MVDITPDSIQAPSEPASQPAEAVQNTPAPLVQEAAPAAPAIPSLSIPTAPAVETPPQENRILPNLGNDQAPAAAPAQPEPLISLTNNVQA